MALERVGHQVGEAENLADARAALSQRRIDLVLCDLRLGEESGIALLRELAPRAPEIVVVMLTGNRDSQTTIECLQNGAFDYVLKPCQMEELEQVIARVLKRRRQMIDARRRVEEQAGLLGQFASANTNPVLRVARDGIILYANAAGEALFAPSNSQAGQPVPSVLSRFTADVFEKGEGSELEVAIDGRTFTFAATRIRDADYVYLYGHDITRHKETERELVRLKEQAQAMALHDPLTGLPNRTLLEDRLAQAIAQCVRLAKKLAVAFIDLDNFKQLNDAHGHHVGDQLLIEAARCISATVRKTDTLARWGGDELILLLPGLNEATQAREVCERIKHVVEKEFARNPLTGQVTLSMGIATYPDDATLPAMLLRQADAALYLAKARGRDAIVLSGETREPPA
jgi:diguanylate cyclase (GGDEF)-like protein